jgi:hypothetical protein
MKRGTFMTFSLRKLRRSLLGVSPKEATSFIGGNSERWHHLATVVLSALEGYHATLDSSRMEEFVPQLDKVALELRGYAYEGAAMGLTGLDCMLPWKHRLQEYLDGPGSPHIYMVHIGAGEALARLRRKPEPFINRMKDHTVSWLVMEGYGFHEGFFHRPRYVEKKVVPQHLSKYAQRIFDQGLGRSIWFTEGANIGRVAATIGTFPVERQADLWLGIGVGSTYVGGLERPEIETLRSVAGPYAIYMAIGAAFVAKGRQRAGNPVPHTNLSCEVLCSLSADQAAHATDLAFLNLPANTPQEAFETLQQRLLARLSTQSEPVYQKKEA